MLIRELEEIVQLNLNKPKIYVRTLLQTRLQLYILKFIYTSKKYKDNFIFTGGTCLKHLFNLPRLSQDLDFDLTDSIEIPKFKEDLKKFFHVHLQYSDVIISTHQKGKQILLKFPILHKFQLSAPNESDLLYLKLDLQQKANLKSANITYTLKHKQNIIFVAKHYDLPTLMSKKISAIFLRNILKGKYNKKTIKGRDFFDLLWFLQNKICPNIKHLRVVLKDSTIDFKKLTNLLDNKIKLLQQKYISDFRSDLIPFIDDINFIDSYVQHYFTLYQECKKYLINCFG